MRGMRAYSKILILVILVFMSQLAFAKLVCDSCPASTCFGTYTTLFTISGGTVGTSHIGSFGTNTMNIRCWDDTQITIGKSGTDIYKTILLRTTATGGHAQIGTYTNYPNIFYISSSQASIACTYPNTACPSDQTCVATMTADTNAHVGTCSENYNIKICCKIQCTQSEAGFCSDGIDNDCDANGYKDYDTLDRGGGAAPHGDNDCPVGVSAISVSDASPIEGTSIDVTCTSTVANVSSIDAYVDSTACSYVSWSGNDVKFSCSVGAAGTKTAKCSINTAKSYAAAGQEQKTTQITVRPSSCSAYTDANSCNGDSRCGWCNECSGTKYSGGAGRCVPTGSCSFSCYKDKCGATCDETRGGCEPYISGENCYYGSTCQSGCTCSPYSSQYCPIPGTKSGNTCYYGTRECSVTGCIIQSIQLQAGQSCTAAGPVDIIAPATSIYCNGAQCSSNWYNSDVNIILSCTDTGGSGCKTTKYKINSLAEQTYSSGFIITTEGTTTLTYYSTDNAGNTETQNILTLKIDKTKPAISSITKNATVIGMATLFTISSAAIDSLSGINTHKLIWNGQTTDCGSAATCTATIDMKNVTGGNNITYYANVTDNASNSFRSLSETIIPCQIISAGIIGTCTSGTCSEGDSLTLSVEYLGACPTTVRAQFDSKTPDNLCKIESTGAAIAGMGMNCISSPCSNSWIMPAIPLICKGKQASPSAAAIYDQETWLDSIANPTGSFKFFINPATIVVTPSINLSREKPRFSEILLVNISAKVLDENSSINCDGINCNLSIKLDGIDYNSFSWMGILWSAQISTTSYTKQQPTSTLNSDVRYIPADVNGTATKSFTVDFPPEISNYGSEPVIGSGYPWAFEADITDDEGDIDRVEACNDITANGCKGLYCVMTRISGNTFSCSFDSSNLNPDNVYKFYIFANDTEGAWSSTKNGFYGYDANTEDESKPIVPASMCSAGETNCNGICTAICSNGKCDSDGICGPEEGCDCTDCSDKPDSCDAGLVCDYSARTCQPDSDNDGVPDGRDVCPDSELELPVGSNGCELSSMILCAEGELKCSDGSCQASCGVPSVCNNNNICEPENGESCNCVDCYEKPASCEAGLACSPSEKTCQTYSSIGIARYTHRIINTTIVFTGVKDQTIPMDESGNPVITRGMDIDVTIKGFVIGSFIECTKSTCKSEYSIDGSPYSEIPWDEFSRGWQLSGNTKNLSCNVIHTIKIKVTYLAGVDRGLSSESQYQFYISCEPRVIITPLERRTAVGQNAFVPFNVTVVNPYQRQQYSIEMNSPRAEYLLAWLNLTNPTGSPDISIDPENNDKANMLIDEMSSQTIYVDMEVAGRSGIFPIKLVATDQNGNKYESTGTLMIFAEGLDEFAAWQLLIMMAAGCFVIFAAGRKLIFEKKKVMRK